MLAAQFDKELNVAYRSKVLCRQGRENYKITCATIVSIFLVTLLMMKLGRRNILRPFGLTFFMTLEWNSKDAAIL